MMLDKFGESLCAPPLGRSAHRLAGGPGGLRRRTAPAGFVVLLLLCVPARADRFSQYGPPDNPFVIAELPAIGSGSFGTAFDALADGRLIAVTGNDVYVESADLPNTYDVVAHLDASETGGSVDPAFVRVSPGGSRIAVGGGFGKPVAVFDVAELGSPGAPSTLTATTSGGSTRYFNVGHFDAEWFDDASLALTAGTFGTDARVTLLDVTSDPAAPVVPVVIDGIDGGSAGIAFDATGRLYTGNGFDNSPGVPGTSETGTIRAFEASEWQAAIGGTPLAFETDGTFVVELLSANALGFDVEGNLFVGGGDFGDPLDAGYFALVDDAALADALAAVDPITPGDETEIRIFDPEGSGFAFYTANANRVTGELYGSWAEGFGVGDRVFIARTVPEPGVLALLALGGGAALLRRRRIGPLLIVPGCLPFVAEATVASPFATQVVEYRPAPGQFVNSPSFNDPTRTLGAPDGNNYDDPNAWTDSVVSLGGFGGSITLRFDHRIVDHPANPMGLDFIVFGNAFYVGGNPQRRWAEAAHVEISKDANGNGEADDAWFLIPGSHIADAAGQYETQEWDDDPGTPTPPVDVGWFPAGMPSPYSTAAYRLPAELFELFVLENPAAPNPFDPNSTTVEGAWGYADFSPTLILGDLNADGDLDDPQDDPNMPPELFYTVPDDPLVVGITPGSGGGDAFDIAWAIDPATGEAANLDGFDFIRISTAVNAVDVLLGELSAEIDAVAEVRHAPSADFDGDGDVDLDDFASFAQCYAGSARPPASACPPGVDADFDADGDVDLDDFAIFAASYTGAL